MSDPQTTPRKVSNLRIICAAALDFITSFAVVGYIIARFTGDTSTDGTVGFSLNGAPAFVLLILIIAYFVIGNRTGGTLWKRILKVPTR